MIKIMLIFGTRPEAIKLAPVIKALQGKDWVNIRICVTAQHREMLDQVLQLFEIKPHYDFNIMQPAQDLSDVTARIIIGLRDIFKQERPDIILVQGDTTTVFAASIAAFYEGIKVGHVEAGLRTNDKKNPFPEEINRRLTSVLTDIHFSPTERAKKNLLSEGFSSEQIFITGNTVVDAILWALKKTEDTSFCEVNTLKEWVSQNIGENRVILITAHRRESFGQPFKDMCCAMKELAQKYPETHLVYPVHLNPNVQKTVYNILSDLPNVHLTEPLSYLPFVWLMGRSYLILTDSGGIQEEAPSLGKPVLVMRETTERPEGINAGTSILVGRDIRKIVTTVESFLNDQILHKSVAQIPNPYGDGIAGQRIADILYKCFCK
jgi:UDP-N-acetylglucosamine 2-epimerase (non-hydrolysing)